MVFTEKGRAFIKNLYLIESYRERIFEKSPWEWIKRSGLDTLLRKLGETEVSKQR